MIKNQKGFAVLETFLLLVIVAIISGVGWYAIHTKHQTDKILSQVDKISKDTPVKTSASQSQNTSSQRYMVIKEWGVKIPITASLNGLGYKIYSDGGIVFSQVDSSNNKICVTEVVIDRGTGSQNVPGSQGISFKQWYEQNQAYYAAKDNYYYVPPGESSGLEVGCGDTEDSAVDKLDTLDQNSNPTLWQKADKVDTEIVNALDKMFPA